MDSKRLRQYLGLLFALGAYYLVHEGAHLLYALAAGVFRQIRFLGLGVQIDIFPGRLTDSQLGLFCLAGPTATLAAGWILAGLADPICRTPSRLFRACLYYTTLAFLLLDPVYLSILCGFFGGGDMNGIRLLVPETAARLMAAGLLLLHGLVFWKKVLPKYTRSFREG